MPSARLGRGARLLLAASLALMVRSALGAEPKVMDGFSVRLVATVPAVLYPCQIATAPDGSLFVAEDPMDQVGPYEADNGRILLFREGKEPVVFAEGLRAVFGMVWRDGSLYVMHMPYLTVFKDTNGDGKADQKKILFKDLGPGPKALNDHIVSGLQFGVDGRLYISVGDKGVPDAHGSDGTNILLKGGGILRCNPDGTKLEIVSSGTRNHLEPNLDDRDNLFTYDNTDDGLGWWTRVTHHIDGGYYGYPYDYHDFKYRMLNRIAEFGGGSPCGGVVYKEDAWPAEFKNRVMWAEWGKRQVAMAQFKPKGASFELAEMSALATPADGLEFRPIDLALSYDGKTLYVADWGMGGWGSKTEKVGRVYAITYTGKNAPKTRPRGKDSDPLDAQFTELDHPSFNERTRAQLAIIKQGKTALPKAVALLADAKTDPVAKRHLVWIIEAIAGGSPDATMPLLNALKSSVADVRAQATRALGIRPAAIAVDELIRLAKADPEPAVRLQAIIALGRIGDAKAIPALGPILVDSDPYLAFSARQALRRIDDWAAASSLLYSKDEKLRDALLDALELQYDKDAVDLLRREATDESRPGTERAKAVRYLSYVLRKAPKWDGSWWGTRPAAGDPPVKSLTWDGTPSVLAALRGAITDSNPAIRLAAVAAARETKEADLVATVRDRFNTETEKEIRVAIAQALAVSRDPKAVSILLTPLRSDHQSDPSVIEAALAAIEKIGGRAAIDGLVRVLGQKGTSVDRQAAIILALGRMRSDSAIKPIKERLTHASPKLRAAAAESLGQIGKSEGVVESIRPLLDDKDANVKKAALVAAASLKDRASVPALVAAANEPATRFEMTLALAKLPDARGLQVYLRGLSDRNQDIRKACASALTAIKTEAVPGLERLAARREIPSSALPELRKIYASAVPIRDWHVMGPFPANERPPVSQGKRVDPKGVVKLDKEELKWVAAKSNDPHGMVDLSGLYAGKNTDKKSAFAFAELTSATARPARVSLGSDDSIQLWLNGREVFRHTQDRGFTPEQDTVEVQLKKGLNLIFAKVGNNSGGWQFSVGVSGESGDYAFLKGPAPGAFDPDAYRTFAASNKGKADRGKTLFNDPKGIGCIKCHAVGGQGGSVGPDLTGIATRYPREELIHSVLYPSAKIFSGYEPTIVATADGKVITGIVKSDTAEALVLEDAEAKKHTIRKPDIEERKTSDVSLMPNGLAEGLTREDFADLIGYLETLKEVPGSKPAGAR